MDIENSQAEKQNMKPLTEHTRDLILALAAGILGAIFVLLMG